MATTMSSMGYYVVMVFSAALFTKAFADSVSTLGDTPFMGTIDAHLIDRAPLSRRGR